MKDKNPIKNTAFLPLLDLAKRTDVPYCDKMWDSIKDIIGDMDPVKKSYFVESRYMGAHEFAREYSQIVELASGFMPHAYHASRQDGNLEKYVEIDFPENIELKDKLLRSSGLTIPHNKHIMIGGDLYDSETWDKIHDSISEGIKTCVFANGFMMYTNEKDRAKLASYLIQLLRKNGGSYFFEDSLTFHPEFSKHKDLRVLSERMSRISKKDLTNYLTQDGLTEEFRDLGFNVARTPAYSNLTSKDIDGEGRVVIKEFRNWILTPRYGK